MNNKKIIFMGTPLIAVEYLSALIKKNFNIEAVFTQPPKNKSRGMKLIKSPIHTLAIDNKIKVFHPKKFDTETINQINLIKPDLIIVMAYGNLLPKEILNLPMFGCINIHVSILPKWRGASPIEHSLINGDNETGITIIKLTENLDAGPIIAQEKFIIPSDYNKEQLTNSLTEIGIKLLLKTIPKILNNDIFLTEQNEEAASYANKITTEIRKINFNKTVDNVINQIRAHSPKPGAWFYLNNERIKIIEAKKGSSAGNASTIINNKFEIACSDGSIKPIILQREGKKIISIEEFLRGYNINTGDRINA